MEKEKNCKIVEEIYLELNKKYGLEGIYTEGFTSEQVYYQVEGLINRVLEEKEKEVNKLYKKFLTVCGDIANGDMDEDIDGDVDEDNNEDVDDHFDEQLDSENMDEHLDSEDMDDQLESENDDDSEAFEKYKKDLEEAEDDSKEEEDEDTLSDEGSIEDPEELKDMPASDLFKRLDKNIKK